MYGIAVTVAACLRSDTRADVAWLVSVDGLTVPDWSDAVVFTPGGGKIGSLAGGALDGQLADRAGRGSQGFLLDLTISEVDALIASLPKGGSARAVLVPADLLPSELWDLATARQPFALVCELDGDVVRTSSVYAPSQLEDAPEAVRRALSIGSTGSTVSEGQVISVFRAVPQLVIVGKAPVTEVLAQLAEAIGWQTTIVTTAEAVGFVATLSPLDKVVVLGHDMDLAGAGLLSALEGQVGYIGSLGGQRMQEARAGWLAYRGMTDLTRVHGPAGLDIGADTPGEIAVSILAEAISVSRPG